jgi:hypothetical protein
LVPGGVAGHLDDDDLWINLINIFTLVNDRKSKLTRGHISSRVRPFYERAVSDLDPYRSMIRPVYVAHSLFIEGSHMTKNTAFVKEMSQIYLKLKKLANFAPVLISNSKFDKL